MRIGEAIKKAMKDKKITQLELSKKMGAKSQSVVAQRLRMDNLSIDKILEMLDIIDYEIVIQPKKNGRRPVGTYVVTEGDKKLNIK